MSPTHHASGTEDHDVPTDATETTTPNSTLRAAAIVAMGVLCALAGAWFAASGIATARTIYALSDATATSISLWGFAGLCVFGVVASCIGIVKCARSLGLVATRAERKARQQALAASRQSA